MHILSINLENYFSLIKHDISKVKNDPILFLNKAIKEKLRKFGGQYGAERDP